MLIMAQQKDQKTEGTGATGSLEIDSEALESHSSSSVVTSGREPRQKSAALDAVKNLQEPVLKPPVSQRQKETKPDVRVDQQEPCTSRRPQVPPCNLCEKASWFSERRQSVSDLLKQRQPRAKSLESHLKENARLSSQETQGQTIQESRSLSLERGRQAEQLRSRSLETHHPSLLLGHWKLQTSQNWDTFLREAGVGIVVRKLSCEMTTYEHITRAGDRWTVSVSSPLKNFESTFCLNEEFEEENLDGKRVKAVASMNTDGNTLTISQTAIETDGLAFTIVREILDSDRMFETVTCKNNGVVAKRYYIRTSQES